MLTGCPDHAIHRHMGSPFSRFVAPVSPRREGAAKGAPTRLGGGADTTPGPRPSASAEREDVGAHAGPGEADLERPLADRPALADELVHPGLGDGAVAGLAGVEPAVDAGRRAVEADGEVHGATGRGRRE